MSTFPIPVVTCTIFKDGEFLVLRRRDAAKKFGGLWGFVGGKVERGETIAGALRREVKEETNLDLQDDCWFVDSYHYGDSLGLHFAVLAASDGVQCMDGYAYKWLRSLEDLQALTRLPGIDYHLARATEMVAQKMPSLSLAAIDYTPDKYIN